MPQKEAAAKETGIKETGRAHWLAALGSGGRLHLISYTPHARPLRCTARGFQQVPRATTPRLRVCVCVCVCPPLFLREMCMDKRKGEVYV